jgi:Immunity protein 35
MISFQQAIEIAEKTIQNEDGSPDDTLIIVENKIIEKPYAWIFPYTSKRWLEGDFNYAIAGNAPLFVDKQDGRISTFRTGLSMEGMIDEYEEQNNAWSLKISTAVYSNTENLLALKGHLKMTQKEITALKGINTAIVGQGAKKRLEKLADVLKTSGIDSEVVLTHAG